MTFTVLNGLLNVFVASVRGFWCQLFGEAEPVFYSFSRCDWFTAQFDEHVENKTLDHEI